MEADLDKGLAASLVKVREDITLAPHQWIFDNYEVYFIERCQQRVNRWVNEDWQPADQIADLEFVHATDEKGEREEENGVYVGEWFGYFNGGNTKKYRLRDSNHRCG